MCRPGLTTLLLLAVTFPLIDPRPLRADEVRETPLTPQQEQETFQLDDKRLTIELVASEPQVDSPVAISWDADGRLYVAEMIDYPLGPTAGRIRLLEDRDGDGRYEHDSVFAAGLNFPNSVLAAQGGVFVTAAPDLLFLKDTDGDGKADEKRVVFTGFAEGNQQLRANGLTWGLDNWIHGANGRSDGNIRRPSDPADKTVSIRARDFRFKPDGSQFEATSGQSQFGQTGDNWGNRFLSWNTIPIRQAVFTQTFLDRNPRLAMFGIRDIADESDTGQVFPLSPRPQTFNKERTDYYNALCGLTIYRGDGLGDDYSGNAFAGESLTSLVHRRVLSPVGPVFISRRAEHGREFLASTDNWFHPVYMTTGPDGALYVVDFYRRWVEHPNFVAESLRGGVDWRKGSGHGRIWKVSHHDKVWPPREKPQMTTESTHDIVQHLDNRNGWWRDTAQRVLIERGDAKAVPLIGLIYHQSRLPQVRLQALATLDGMSALDEHILQAALEDGDARVRSFALRLATPRLATAPKLRQSVITLSEFRDPLVRFNAALALGSVEGPDKLKALVKLADRETADPWIPLALVGSLGRSAGGFLDPLLKTFPQWRRNPTAAQIHFLGEVAATIALGDDTAARNGSMTLITPANPKSVSPGDLAILAGLAHGIADRGQAPRTILTTASPSAGTALDNLVAAARAMAPAEDESLHHRLLAVDILGLLDTATSSGNILVALLDVRHPQGLQSAAAAALGQTDPATAERMFATWGAMTTATRRALASASLRSATATAGLIKSIEEERIQLRELEPGVRDALKSVRDPALQARLKPLFDAEPVGVNRQDVVAKFASVLERAGNRQRGAAVFEKHCLTCHSIQGRGQRVGPDLSGIGARPKETLLIDIFDPSRQVSPDFVNYTLVTRQGQVLTGLLASETASSITLRRAEGAQDTVLRAQIEELRGTGKSLMPEGLEQNLSEENIVDVIEFLARPDAKLFSQAR